MLRLTVTCASCRATATAAGTIHGAAGLATLRTAHTAAGWTIDPTGPGHRCPGCTSATHLAAHTMATATRLALRAATHAGTHLQDIVRGDLPDCLLTSLRATLLWAAHVATAPAGTANLEPIALALADTVPVPPPGRIPPITVIDTATGRPAPTGLAAATPDAVTAVRLIAARAARRPDLWDALWHVVTTGGPDRGLAVLRELVLTAGASAEIAHRTTTRRTP